MAAAHREEIASSVAVAAAELPSGAGRRQQARNGNHHRGGGEDTRGLDKKWRFPLDERERGREDKGVERFFFSRPWYLRAMGWDCVSECGYTCMTMHVEIRVAEGQRVQQYHGKWPFRREGVLLFSIQKPSKTKLGPEYQNRFEVVMFRFPVPF